MKILFVAVFSETSTNNSQSRGLQAAGCSVIEYNYRLRAEELGGGKRDNDIIETCLKERPNLVIFSKCNGVHWRVIEECNKVSKTALWYMDPMHNFNDELIEKIKRCTYTFCALWEPRSEATKYRNPDFVHFLHEGFDSDINIPVKADYKHDVSFIGSLRGERGRYQQKYHFYNYTNAFGKDHCLAVAETKINLNFTEGGTSDRTYKVLASRGFLLTQPWPGLERDFTPDKDLVVFQGEEDFERKVKYYLNHDKEREIIAEHGYKTVQKFSRHSWAKRLLELI